MQRKFIKRKTLFKRALINMLMLISVCVLVTAITLIMFGFRFDSINGELEQNAFLQFSSTPSAATVSIDGNVIGSKTSTKSSVRAGKHSIVMWRDGYQTWKKTVTVRPGTITGLNYTLLVPKKLPVEAVAEYKTIHNTLASPKGNYFLVQPSSNIPSYKLTDITSDNIVSKSITIPSSIYSEPTTTGVNHSFNLIKWDDSERYVIVNHKYSDKVEWIVMDTQDETQTKNVSKTFNITIDKALFSSNSGNNLYTLGSGDIRKLDINAGTISKPLVSNVTDFDFYNESKVITYIGIVKTGSTDRVAGLYRDGDSKPAVIRTVKGDASVPLHISTTRYFNENYVAISEGKKVDILNGSYPNTTSDNANSLKTYASFITDKDVQQLSFSPKGRYVLAQSGANFSSYNLEYQKLSSSTISASVDVLPIKWLDENHIWSGADSVLSIRDFDGKNVYSINPVLIDQDVTLTNNGRFLYSINKSATGISLQRVRMILP